MTAYKATSEQWENMKDCEADNFDDGYAACILELRARVEALEATQRPASLSEPLQLTPEQAQHISDLITPNSSDNTKELCRELLRALDSYPIRPMAHRQLCERARQVLRETSPADYITSFTNTHGIPERY